MTLNTVSAFAEDLLEKLIPVFMLLVLIISLVLGCSFLLGIIVLVVVALTGGHLK